MKTLLRAALLMVWLAAVALPSGGQSGDLSSMDMLMQNQGSVNTISINYRQVTFDKILDDLRHRRPDMNINLKGDPKDLQALRQRPFTIGPVSGVTWDVAIKYVADQAKLNVDKSQLGENIITLELVERFTDTYSGTELAAAVMNIAERGKANIIFTPKVEKNQPVYLTFRDVPWREALESLLKANGCTVLYDSDGKILRVATMSEAEETHETRARALRYIQPEGPHFQAKVLREEAHDFVDRILDMRNSNRNNETTIGRSMLNALENIKSETGKITYESRTNTLIMRDTPIKVQEMMRVIDEIDVCPPQVFVQSRLITYSENPTTKVGVKWGEDNEYGEYDGISVGPSMGPSWNSFWPWGSSDRWGHLAGVMNPIAGAPTSTGNTPGRISLTTLSAMLQLAKQDDRFNIVQAPELLVLDNEEATIYIGDVRKYMLVERERDKDGYWTWSLDERDLLVGVQLFVIPHIVRDSNQVMMEVIPKEVMDPEFTEMLLEDNPYTYPSRYKVKQVHTKMMLNSTETGVIAGLMRDQVRDFEKKLPFLGDLPIIGYLFKNKQTYTTKENNFVFITPTILPPNDRPNFDSEVEALKQSVASSYKPNDAHPYR